MFLYGYFEYLLWMLPAVILSAIAQAKVSSAYNRNSKLQNSRGLSGAEAARRVLASNGVTGVNITTTAGRMTDHFDPRNNTIYLSEGVYSATTIAAVGIASHEAGHAVQHAQGYLPNKLRSALVPITKIGSTLGWILLIIGFVFSGYYYYTVTDPNSTTYKIGGVLIVLGILLYSTSLIFTLVTLPVEFNASKRALKTIEETRMLEGEEYKGAKSVLSAAAMTYVAAAFTALLQLLRVILIAKRRR